MTRGKIATPLDLPRPILLLQGNRAITKQESVYESLRGAILNKLLPAHSRLPSTRTLAVRWRLSRGTVEAAFDRLQSEGYVTRLPGSGTRVSAIVPDSFIAAHGAPLGAPHQASAGPARAPSRCAAEAEVQYGVPFVARLADPALFPMAIWSKFLAKAMASAAPASLCSSDPSGNLDLRAEIADYLGKYRGIRCHAHNVIVTTGIRHSIDLVARSVLNKGDEVCVEDPGYPAAQKIFKMTGARLCFIPMESDGISGAALRRHRNARLAYVTPAHQSPLGITMSVSRRLELLDWASQGKAWIVEDDYDSEFNYRSAPLAALKAIDKYDRVIYCGSFNKTLFAGLRIGFMVVPTQLRDQLLSLWQTTGRSVAITEQIALADYMKNGAFVRHLRLARHAYQERRDIILTCLAGGAPGRHTISGQHAGFHFVLWLPEDSDAVGFCARAAERGLMLQPLEALCRKVKLPPAVLIGYTAISTAQARFSGRNLARLLVE